MAAGLKLTDIDFFGDTLSLLDLMHIVDVSDTSQDPEGSSYKLPLSTLKTFFNQNLNQVLTVGNATDGKDIVVSTGDSIAFWNTTATFRTYLLNDQATGSNKVVYMPQYDGQLAYHATGVPLGDNYVLLGGANGVIESSPTIYESGGFIGFGTTSPFARGHFYINDSFSLHQLIVQNANAGGNTSIRFSEGTQNAFAISRINSSSVFTHSSYHNSLVFDLKNFDNTQTNNYNFVLFTSATSQAFKVVLDSTGLAAVGTTLLTVDKQNFVAINSSTRLGTERLYVNGTQVTSEISILGTNMLRFAGSGFSTITSPNFDFVGTMNGGYQFNGFGTMPHGNSNFLSLIPNTNNGAAATFFDSLVRIKAFGNIDNQKYFAVTASSSYTIPTGVLTYIKSSSGSPIRIDGSTSNYILNVNDLGYYGFNYSSLTEAKYFFEATPASVLPGIKVYKNVGLTGSTIMQFATQSPNSKLNIISDNNFWAIGTEDTSYPFAIFQGNQYVYNVNTLGGSTFTRIGVISQPNASVTAKVKVIGHNADVLNIWNPAGATTNFYFSRSDGNGAEVNVAKIMSTGAGTGVSATGQLELYGYNAGFNKGLTVYKNGGINLNALPTGNAGLATGDLYKDTAANILANGDYVVGMKV